jgi:hypothetical protein
MLPYIKSGKKDKKVAKYPMGISNRAIKPIMDNKCGVLIDKCTPKRDSRYSLLDKSI